MATIQLQDREFFYYEHQSDRTGRTLCFIHGAGGSHRVWPEGLLAWPEARVIAVDLPGHGRSAPPGRRSINQYAIYVENFINALRLTNLILVGHSMGSAIALAAAQRRAVDLDGLILFGASGRMPVADPLLGGSLSSLDQVAAFIAESGLADAAAAEREEVRNEVLATGGITTFGDFLACNRFDLRPHLADIDIPALIISGRLDVMTPLRFSESLAAGLPQSRLHILDDTGHFAMRERPDAVRKLIAGFLSELAG